MHWLKLYRIEETEKKVTGSFFSSQLSWSQKGGGRSQSRGPSNKLIIVVVSIKGKFFADVEYEFFVCYDYDMVNLANDDSSRFLTVVYVPLLQHKKSYYSCLQHQSKRARNSASKYLHRRHNSLNGLGQSGMNRTLVESDRCLHSHAGLPAFYFRASVIFPKNERSKLDGRWDQFSFLGLAASLDLEVEQMDVKTAFLHGDLDKEIYMEQPEGFQVKGKKGYGVTSKQKFVRVEAAPRQWYKKFESVIGKQGYRKTSSDHCVFFQKFGDDDFIILLLYVDDMLIVGKTLKNSQLSEILSKSVFPKRLGASKTIIRHSDLFLDTSAKKICPLPKNIEKIDRSFHMASRLVAYVCYGVYKSDILHQLVLSVVPVLSWGAVFHGNLDCKSCGIVHNKRLSRWQQQSVQRTMWLKRDFFAKNLVSCIQRYAFFVTDQNGILNLKKYHTDDNASDMLTKAVAREKLKNMWKSCKCVIFPPITEDCPVGSSRFLDCSFPDIEGRILTVGL
ncbi:putative RNA-directed DNA polymerase [Tanacetum coccineum]